MVPDSFRLTAAGTAAGAAIAIATAVTVICHISIHVLPPWRSGARR